MGRIVVFLLLALVVWWLLRGLFKAQKGPPAAPAPHAEGEDMVACSRCGVNLPVSEARLEAGRYVCNDNPRCVQKR